MADNNSTPCKKPAVYCVRRFGYKHAGLNWMPVERPAFIIRYAKKAEDRAAKTGRIYNEACEELQKLREKKSIFTDN